MSEQRAEVTGDSTCRDACRAPHAYPTGGSAVVTIDQIVLTLRATFGVMLVGAIGCGHHAPIAPAPSPAIRPTFAVMVVESDAFPGAARVTTEKLQHAPLHGEPRLSKVSLEVVQLSIECVEPTPICYTAVGKELAVDQLLFAEIAPGPKAQQVQVKVTWFDVDARRSKRSVVKVFSNEAALRSSIDNVVAEATRP